MIDRIKMKGSGSQRFKITRADPEIENKIGAIQGDMFCNIELRKRGLVLYFRSRIETYALALPYFTVSIVKNNDELTIYSRKYRITMKPGNNARFDRKFYLKLLKLKEADSCDDCARF